jgi:hypothetical protein
MLLCLVSKGLVLNEKSKMLNETNDHPYYAPKSNPTMSECNVIK